MKNLVNFKVFHQVSIKMILINAETKTSCFNDEFFDIKINFQITGTCTIIENFMHIFIFSAYISCGRLIFHRCDAGHEPACPVQAIVLSA